MTIDYSIIGHVVISMINYIVTMLNEAGDEMDGISQTPAASFLFEVYP